MLNQRIGALWKKTSKKDGMTFYSGTIDTMFGKVSISVFKNDKKEKDNQPDLNIVFNGVQPYEDRQRASSSSLDDPFADDGHATPPDDAFNDHVPPKTGGYDGDLNNGEAVIEL